MSGRLTRGRAAAAMAQTKNALSDLTNRAGAALDAVVRRSSKAAAGPAALEACSAAAGKRKRSLSANVEPSRGAKAARGSVLGASPFIRWMRCAPIQAAELVAEALA